MGYGGKTFRVDRSGSSFDLRSSKYSKCQGILRDILRAEQDLRELVQLEETLQHRVIAFKKASYIEPDATQIEKIEKQLEETQAKYARKAHDLYECEISIPMELKDAYDSLRHNPKWFMREGMVEDCSQRGGCCSRVCGCCERRHLSKKGQGHCTFECWCCFSHRKVELTDEDKGYMKESSRKLLNSFNYLERVGNWHFDQLRFGELSKTSISKPQKSKGTFARIFGLGFVGRGGL